MPHPLELIHPRNLKYLSAHLQTLAREQLWLQVLIGMVSGLCVGVMLSQDAGLVARDTATLLSDWLVLPGNLFLTLIQMIVIPLVVASVVRGIASSGSVEQLRTSGLHLLIYFLFTTTVAISLGVGAATLIKPGTFADATTVTGVAASIEAQDTETPNLVELPHTLLSILPSNPLNAAVEQQMLQVVIFSVIFGLALVSVPPAKAAPLLEVFGSLQSVVMRVVSWVMRLAPYAVFGFMVQVTMQTGLSALTGIGMYVLTVLGGLAALLLFYTFIALMVGRIHPLRFFTALRELQLLAFSTNSSVAVLPVTMRTAEEKLGVRPSTAQFVAPIGATVNMDGTALFHGAATLFLLQVYGVELSIAMLLALVTTAIGASIGTPATPGVGIVILSAVLTGIGVPLQGVALIVGVDRVLELFRTATNVTGDVVASVVIDRISHASPPEAERAREARAEAVRAETGEDVVTGELDGGGVRAAADGIWARVRQWFRGGEAES